VLDVAPVTLSLVVGGAIPVGVRGVLIGWVAAATRGQHPRSHADDARAGRRLHARLLAGRGDELNHPEPLFHEAWRSAWGCRAGATSRCRADPVGWFLTLVSPGSRFATLYMGLYGRVLRANLVKRAGGLHPHGPRKGLSDTRSSSAMPCATSADHDVTLFGSTSAPSSAAPRS